MAQAGLLCSSVVHAIEYLSSADFYGAGAGYNVFAGKDCTRAVALWSLDEKDFTDDIVSIYHDR